MQKVLKFVAALFVAMPIYCAIAVAETSQTIAIAGNVESKQPEVGFRPFVITTENPRSESPTWNIRTGNLSEVNIGSVLKLGLAKNRKDKPLLAATTGVWRAPDIVSAHPVWTKIFDPAKFTASETTIPSQFFDSAVTSIIAADSDPGSPGNMVLLIKRTTPIPFVDLFVVRTSNFGETWEVSPRIKIVNPAPDGNLQEASIIDGYDVEIKKGSPDIVMISIGAYASYLPKGGYILTSVNGGASFLTNPPKQKLPFTDAFGQTAMIDSCDDCVGIFAWGNSRYDQRTMSFTVSYDLGDTWETRSPTLNLDRSNLTPISFNATAPLSLITKHPMTDHLFFAPDPNSSIAGVRLVESGDDFHSGVEHVLAGGLHDDGAKSFGVGIFSQTSSEGSPTYFVVQSGPTANVRAVYSTQNFQSWSSKPVAPYYAAACYGVGEHCAAVYPRSIAELAVKARP